MSFDEESDRQQCLGMGDIYVYVPSYTKHDGTWVHGYCRRMGEDEIIERNRKQFKAKRKQFYVEYETGYGDKHIHGFLTRKEADKWEEHMRSITEKRGFGSVRSISQDEAFDDFTSPYFSHIYERSRK